MTDNPQTTPDALAEAWANGPLNREIAAARKYLAGGKTVREAAVYGVDDVAGFTYEFASVPAEHAQMYDLVEEALQS